MMMAFCVFPAASCSDDDEDSTILTPADSTGMTDNDSIPTDSVPSDSVLDDSIPTDSIITDSIPVTEPARLDSMELYCYKGVQKIYGILYNKVKKGEKAPAVILSHSSSLTHEAMRGYARAIADRGMVAYCFDFCGGSDKSKSDGLTDSMTVFTEVDDLKAVLGDIRKLDIVNPDSIYLMGSSQGGLVSALVAEEKKEEVCGMILFYPAFNIPELVSQILDMMSQYPGLGGGFGGGFGGMSMNTHYMNSIKDYDVWSHIGQFRKPILICHGTNDIIVNISYSEKAVGIYGGNATLERIQGANHGFNEANLTMDFGFGDFGGWGGMGGMGGTSATTANYDNVVLPLVYRFLNR